MKNDILIGLADLQKSRGKSLKRGIIMLKKRSVLVAVTVIALLIVALSVILIVAKLNTDSSTAAPDLPDASQLPDKDPELLYEMYIDGQLSCTVGDIREVFTVADEIESSMSEKLGYAYSISNDLNVELVAVRKVSETVSSSEIHSLLSDKLSALYSDSYAFYVGEELIGYSPLSEKEELEDLAVDIIKYISSSNSKHPDASSVYVTLAYTYKTNIVANISGLSKALSSTGTLEGLDESITSVIESIDKAVLFGSTSDAPESVEPEIVVSSVRRVETEVVPYKILKFADVECPCEKCKTSIYMLGTDDPDVLHQEGKKGKCTVEYEDIYIGDELSHSVRIEDSKVIVKAPVDEITLYGTQSVVASGKMTWPTVGWVTSEYGPRKSEFAGMSSYHKGIDISTSRKTKIVAADAGVVEFAGWHSGGFGYCVIIDHGNGLKTLYAHMYTKPLVEEGELVFKGEHLGGQGMTGSAGGIHLHFEVIRDGERINPRKYLPKGYPPTAW